MHRIELIRRLLLHIEQHSRDAWIDLWICGYEEDAVIDCVRMLQSLGYLETESVRVGNREYWKSVRPTLSGSRLIETARNEVLWSHGRDNATNLAAFLESRIQDVDGSPAAP
jgi:hypothetical protein